MWAIKQQVSLSNDMARLAYSNSTKGFGKGFMREFVGSDGTTKTLQVYNDFESAMDDLPRHQAENKGFVFVAKQIRG